MAFLPSVIFKSRIDDVGLFNLKDVLKFKLDQIQGCSVSQIMWLGDHTATPGFII